MLRFYPKVHQGFKISLVHNIHQEKHRAIAYSFSVAYSYYFLKNSHTRYNIRLFELVFI